MLGSDFHFHFTQTNHVNLPSSNLTNLDSLKKTFQKTCKHASKPI